MNGRTLPHRPNTFSMVISKASMQTDSNDRLRNMQHPIRITVAILFAFLICLFDAYSFQDEIPRSIVARETQTILSGHTNFVDCIAFSRDNKHLASAGEDSKTIIWDLSTGRELRTLDAGGMAKSSVAFSPDGKTLAIGSWNNITLWDVSTWSLLFTFLEPSNLVTALTFTPDNKLIVSGDRSGKINVWNVSDGKLINSFKAFALNVTGLAVDTSGTIVVAGGWGDSLTAWNIQSGNMIYSVPAHHNGITGIALSPDGKTIATAGIYQYSEPRLWNVYTGKIIRKFDRENSRGHVVFSKDGRFLFDGGEQGEIDVWNIATGRVIQSLNCRGSVKSIALSPDGRKIAVASSKYVTMWDIASPTESNDSCVLHIRRPLSQVCSISVPSVGDVLAAGREDGQVVLLNLLQSSPLTSFGRVHGAASTVALSPDAKSLLCISSTLAVTLWDVAAAQKSRLLVGCGDELSLFPLSSAASFSADAKMVASIFQFHLVKVWDAKTGHLIANLNPTNNSHLLTMAFNPAATMLAAGGYNCMINIWNPHSGKSVRTIGHETTINTLSFSPNGDLLACGSLETKPGQKNSITVWNIKSGEEAFTFSGNQKSVIALAFSPDGRSLASADEDGGITVWDVTNRELRRNLAGHSAAVHSLAFEPRTSILFSAGDDGTIKLWNISSGAELATLIFIDDTDWVITTPQGYFDGTPEGMTHIYWTRRDRAVATDSLFIKFHDSGLAGKILKIPSH